MKYNISLRVLHWITAIFIITLLAVGFYMVGLSNSDSTKYIMYAYHKSFGVLLLMFAILKLAVRLSSNVPPMPKQLSSTEVLLAKIGHIALYFLMFVMPISGILMSMLSGNGVAFFGYPLPNLFGLNKDSASLFYTVHTSTPIVFVSLIVIHVSAIAYHYLKNRINILIRII